MLDFKSYASSSSGNLNTLSDGETRIMLERNLILRHQVFLLFV